MLITVIDDEALALKAAAGAVREALPQADIHTFSKHGALLEFAQDHLIDIAFLDISLRGISGIEVAQMLENTNPHINIIFVTGYSEYKSSAMDLHASGYLMKPVTAEDITREIQFLRYPVAEKSRVHVTCFGSFSAEIDGSPIRFAYNKTLELLAYLVDRHGATISYNELSAVLWEDDTHISYLKRLRADLKNTFDSYGLPEVIITRKGSLSININAIDCDYFDYLNGIPAGRTSFSGEYMTQYSWAEGTLASLIMK